MASNKDISDDGFISAATGEFIPWTATDAFSLEDWNTHAPDDVTDEEKAVIEARKK